MVDGPYRPKKGGIAVVGLGGPIDHRAVGWRWLGSGPYRSELWGDGHCVGGPYRSELWGGSGWVQGPIDQSCGVAVVGLGSGPYR